MRRTIGCALLALAVGGAAAPVTPAVASSGTRVHPVHVTSTRIELARDGRSLEVTVRLFTDDLEEALFKAESRRVRFGTTPSAVLDSVVDRYVGARLRLMTDGAPAPGRLLGHERDEDAVIVYVEVPVRSAPRRLEVSNQLLLEMFHDQTNLVHATVAGQRRSALLRRGEERALLTFD
jgi:hypothetical protein